MDTIDYINLKLVIIVYAYFHAQIKQYIVEVNLYFFFFSKKKNYSFLKIKVNKEVIIMEWIKKLNKTLSKIKFLFH